ncbi:MAG TPA: asparagine synthase C-terminal domain-containing protein, partial [Myxococcota bacterium]|nr:asparagine synthase C-terminal domain-containing protein [Myxococcota bacterium]
DSSALACLWAEHGEAQPRWRTYKAVLGSPVHDQEAQVADVVARVRGRHVGVPVLPHHVFAFRKAILGAVAQPYERSILAAHWVVRARMAADGVTGTQDGLGADELLGGYRPWLTHFAALHRGERVPGLRLVSASRPAVEDPGPADVSRACAWLAGPARDLAVEKARQDRCASLDSFSSLCVYHMHHGALPMLLRYNRDFGAAFAQAARSPFLAPQVATFLLRLGAHHKVDNGQSKAVLRRALGPRLPPRVRAHDDKRSYADLEVAWLGGPSFGRLLGEVRTTCQAWPQLLDASQRVSVWTAPVDKYTCLRLWRIACFGAWARQFGVSEVDSGD